VLQLTEIQNAGGKNAADAFFATLSPGEQDAVEWFSMIGSGNGNCSGDGESGPDIFRDCRD